MTAHITNQHTKLLPTSIMLMDREVNMKSRPMDRAGIEQRVMRIVKEVLVIDEETVDLDVSITEQLAPDSLDQMRLYMALEDEFQDTIPEDEMERIHTVRDIIKSIETKHAGI